MSVGTTPLTIHAPLSAPMRSRMTSADPTLAMLSQMAFSKAFHGTPKHPMPSVTHRALTTSSVT